MDSAERRQLTVLFADLVGSLQLSSQLDPEDFRAIVRGYQRACADVIGRFEGHIAQYLGDGILAYFGHPKAHEDDARRAVRSALAIVKAVKDLADRWQSEHGVDVHLRVGIHTGLVVVGDVGAGERPEQLAMGEAPNMAARVQGVAEPDAIVISHATHRLARGYFNCEALGAQELKGVAQPVHLFRVIDETGAASPLEAAAVAGLTPFVGRGDEIELTLTRWREACSGETRVVLLRGDAGMGKSRHVRELTERVARETPVILEGHGSPYWQSSAFHPIIEMLERHLQLERRSSDRDKLERLAPWLQECGFLDAGGAVALLAQLLSIALPPDHPPLNITPQRQRRRTIETLRDVIVATARRRPAALIFEDLHWFDPSTLEFLDEMVLKAPPAPLLVILTFRTEFTPPWGEAPQVTELTLGRLGDEASVAIIESLTGHRQLPKPVTERVIARAEGNPLFVEEITKAVMESGALADRGERYELLGSLPDRLIPDTVQASLNARIDRLGSSKPVAQLASAIGREFGYDILSAVAQIPEPELLQALHRMVGAELLFQFGTVPHARFSFKHALIQDAAYQSVLRSRRQQIHETIARVLLERFSEIVEAQPELLAHHLTAGGQVVEAIPCWQKAGERAAQRSANIEAASHLTKALELVRSLPDGPERLQQELALQITLGPILMATKGYANPDVAATYRRAREISGAVGETPQILGVLYGLWSYDVVRGDLLSARDLTTQILRLVRAGDPSGFIHAHVASGVTAYFLGDFLEAREQFRTAVHLHDPTVHRAHAWLVGQEPGMAAHIYLAKTLAVMGDPDGAEHHRRLAADIARATDHHHTSAFCAVYEAFVRHLAGEARAVIEVADRTIALADEEGFPIWKAGAAVLKGSALGELGDCEQGMAFLQSGIELWKATGTNLYTPYWLGLLAMAESEAGRNELACQHIDEALGLEEKGAEGLALAELHRLKGEVVLRLSRERDDVAAARSSFHRAIDIARKQQAGTWELRAVASLVRLVDRGEGAADARHMLAEILGRLPAGADTADLREARALMAQR